MQHQPFPGDLQGRKVRTDHSLSPFDPNNTCTIYLDSYFCWGFALDVIICKKENTKFNPFYTEIRPEYDCIWWPFDDLHVLPDLKELFLSWVSPSRPILLLTKDNVGLLKKLWSRNPDIKTSIIRRQIYQMLRKMFLFLGKQIWNSPNRTLFRKKRGSICRQRSKFTIHSLSVVRIKKVILHLNDSLYCITPTSEAREEMTWPPPPTYCWWPKGLGNFAYGCSGHSSRPVRWSFLWRDADVEL